MNILVIGNGFDLAHGLPTKYGDFLEFCERIEALYSYDELGSHNEYNPGKKAKHLFAYQQQYFENWKTDEYIKNILFSLFIEKYRTGYVPESKALKEIYTCTSNNAWINFFMHCESYIGDNWIDFEAEVSKVIQDLDAMRVILRNNGSIEEVSKDKWKILSSICEAANGSTRDSIGSIQAIDRFTKFLNVELEKLIRALEIYIAEFVEKIEIVQRNCDIDKLIIGHVLSFNYSETYKKIYGADEKIIYDYIHGKADINNTVESNNIVMGIDEYLTKKRKRETEFIVFKKYYQRIYKGTGCEYKNWIYKIKENAKSLEKKLRKEYSVQIPYDKFTKNMKHNLYVFGHSLDVTDGDILRELILNDNVYTTIYYHKAYDENGKDDSGKADLGSKIANLVKVIGQDELIRRTGGSTKTIEFKLQQDMTKI